MGEWIPSTHKVFLSFLASRRIKNQHLRFSIAVRSSFEQILGQVYCWSFAMVTRYDVISSISQSNFG